MSNILENIIKIKANLGAVFVTLMDPSTSEVERSIQFDQTKSYIEKITDSINDATSSNDLATAQHSVELKEMITKFYLDYSNTYALNISPAIFNKDQFITMNNDLTNAMSGISKEFDEPVKTTKEINNMKAQPYSDVSNEPLNTYFIIKAQTAVPSIRCTKTDLQNYLNKYYKPEDIADVIEGNLIGIKIEEVVTKTFKVT